MKVWTLDFEQYQQVMDQAKILFLSALVDEGLLEQSVADDWCASHTIALRQKSIWRTISNRWKNIGSDDDGSLNIVVVTSILRKPAAPETLRAIQMAHTAAPETPTP